MKLSHQSDAAVFLGASLLRRVVVSVVHRPDDDDLLQALRGGGLRVVHVVRVLRDDDLLGAARGGWRRPQLLHQGVEGVRVDGLLLVGFEGHLVRGVDGRVSGLRLEVLDGLGGGSGGGGGCGWRRGFGVRGGGLRVGWLAFGDGRQSFVFLGEFALDEGHRMTGSQEDHCSGSLLVLPHFVSVSLLLVFDHVLHAGEPVSTQQTLHSVVPLWVKSSHVLL